MQPALSGYELRAARGFFGMFVPCGARNLWNSPFFDFGQSEVGDLYEICCWPGSTYQYGLCQQRRGDYALEVTGQGVYLPFEVTAEHLLPDENLDPAGCWNLFGLSASNVNSGDEARSCASWFTFSLDLRGPMGSAWQLSVHKNNMGKTLVRSKTVYGTGFWQRDDVNITFPVEEAGLYLLSIRRHPDCPLVDEFTWYIDGPNVFKGQRNSSFVHGEPDAWYQGDNGLSWAGDAHNSDSLRAWDSHQGGELARFKDFGFRVTGHRGLGEAPRQHVTSPYALRPGTYHQRQRYRHREFQIRGQFTTGDVYELHHKRQALMMLHQRLMSEDENPTRMRYQLVSDHGRPMGRELLIDCRIVSGLGGRVASDYGEEIELSYVADSPYIYEERDVVAVANFTTETLAADRLVRITNEGDAPSPFWVFISGEGHLTGIENRTTGQTVEVDWTMPGNGHVIFAPNDTNHQCKAFWLDYATNIKTELMQYVTPGSHLPILELAPTNLCRKGVNEIVLTFADDVPMAVTARIYSRNAFCGVDSASIADLNMLGRVSQDAWAV